MQHLVAENYESHPKFALSETPLTIDLSLIDQFSKLFGSPREYISKSHFVDACSVLHEIFSDLRNQCDDEYLDLFLSELEDQVKTLIESDFYFRQRIKTSGMHQSKQVDQLMEQDHFFGSIDPIAVDKILKIGQKSLEGFRHNARSGRFKRTDLSVDSGKIPKKISKVIDKEFKKQGIFDAVSKFVGVKYRFTGVSFELSSEGSTWWKDALGNEVQPKTMYAHLDESIFAPKAIVYLSDVSLNNGPTTCYPKAYREINNSALQDAIGRVVGRVGSSPSSRLFDYYKKSYHQSSGSPEFRRHFMMLPAGLRFNSHFGWDVLPGSNLEEELAKREVIMLGDAGTFIVFDGSNLLHRGGLIEKGERIVLQVIFYRGIRFTYTLKALKQLLMAIWKK